MFGYGILNFLSPMKNCFVGAKETPDILRGCHRNPYQLENAIKIGGTGFFFHIPLGLNSLPESCAQWLQSCTVIENRMAWGEKGKLKILGCT